MLGSFCHVIQFAARFTADTLNEMKGYNFLILFFFLKKKGKQTIILNKHQKSIGAQQKVFSAAKTNFKHQLQKVEEGTM